MKFTEEEIKNIINDYNDGMTPKELGDKYNRNSSSIIGKLKSIGIFKPSRHRWTSDDIEFLREYYPIGDYESIFNRFPNMTKQNIISICSSHGISADYFNEKKWTDDDLKIVEKYYYEKSVEEIRKMIGYRHTCDAIQTKALRKFGYSKDNSWTDDEICILKTYYPIEYVDEVCKRLPNRTRGAIIREANNLGVKNLLALQLYWNDKDEKILIDNWKTMSDLELSSIIGKDKRSIQEKRLSLGFVREPRRNGKSYDSLKKYIRGHLSSWKTESMKACNYKCVLTGSKDFQIHHLYSFSAIFDEVLEDTGFVLKNDFIDYSNDELSFIVDRFIEKHDEYPLGICVKTDIHDLFHHINGSRVTPDMWYRFVDDYKNGTLKIA